MRTPPSFTVVTTRRVSSSWLLQLRHVRWPCHVSRHGGLNRITPNIRQQQIENYQQNLQYWPWISLALPLTAKLLSPVIGSTDFLRRWINMARYKVQSHCEIKKVCRSWLKRQFHTIGLKSWYLKRHSSREHRLDNRKAKQKTCRHLPQSPSLALTPNLLTCGLTCQDVHLGFAKGDDKVARGGCSWYCWLQCWFLTTFFSPSEMATKKPPSGFNYEQTDNWTRLLFWSTAEFQQSNICVLPGWIPNQ